MWSNMRGLYSYIIKSSHSRSGLNPVDWTSENPNEIIFNRYKQENLPRLVHQEIEFRIWTEEKWDDVKLTSSLSDWENFCLEEDYQNSKDSQIDPSHHTRISFSTLRLEFHRQHSLCVSDIKQEERLRSPSTLFHEKIFIRHLQMTLINEKMKFTYA